MDIDFSKVEVVLGVYFSKVGCVTKKSFLQLPRWSYFLLIVACPQIGTDCLLVDGDRYKNQRYMVIVLLAV